MDSLLRENDGSGAVTPKWFPAYAGNDESGWFPVCTGMTALIRRFCVSSVVIPLEKGIQLNLLLAVLGL